MDDTEIYKLILKKLTLMYAFLNIPVPNVLFGDFFQLNYFNWQKYGLIASAMHN